MLNFKKIILIVLVITTSCILISFVAKPSENENETTEKYLTVRVMEAQGAFLGSFMIIVDESGKSETFELDRLTTKKAPFENNIVKINSELNSIAEKGYKLIGQSGGNDQYCATTVYTFVKK